ncbi:sigma-70 family RNA polymerase sigma factor [Streptomyces sp. NPDC006393]|uniref:RNA polymerase sigma factor n=1 Tax=Streptomyces sp. NPDC006393 TaxID=3156763 RepID=UPI0033E82A6B
MGQAPPDEEDRAERRSSEERAAPARPRQLPTAVYPGWEAIYEDNVGWIHRLMYNKVGNRPDAEDLTSQVFLTALKPLRTTATVGEVRAYLLATARTVLAAHWQRTLGRQITVIDIDVTDLEDYAEPVGHHVSSRAEEHAGRILAALPERHRRILSLRFLLGYSVKEAAADMGITVANAKVLQYRALRKAAGLEPYEAARPGESTTVPDDRRAGDGGPR